MKSTASSRLNLSSPIYQSPIRVVKRTDTLRLPIGLNTSSFKNQILLSDRTSKHFQHNIQNQNQYTQRKICCPNCRYLFNLAIDEKIIDVLTKQKNTQTDYGEYEYLKQKAQEKINQENQRTAKQLGMKVKSVLLMEKLIDLSKSKTPKQEVNDDYEISPRSRVQQSRVEPSKRLPYQQIKWKQIQALLKYAKQYLKDDVPAYIRMMFQDNLLWGQNFKVPPPSSIKP